MPGPVYGRILDVVRQVPQGQVATYGQIAMIAGDCTPRMVGYCLAALDSVSDVPWQRVINYKGMVSPRRQRTRQPAPARAAHRRGSGVRRPRSGEFQKVRMDGAGGVTMPEAPEMQVVAEFLRVRLPGREIANANVLKPIVRSLAGDMEDDAEGRRFESVERRGKFMLLGLSGGRSIVINPKLTGALQYCAAKTRVQKRTCVRFRLVGDVDLRYTDDRQMGQFYYVEEDQVDQVPGLSEQGPDVPRRDRIRRVQEPPQEVPRRDKGCAGQGAGHLRDRQRPTRTRYCLRRACTRSDAGRTSLKTSFAVSMPAHGRWCWRRSTR